MMNSFIPRETLDRLNNLSHEFSPLVLAYIGDSVFEMYVRTMLLKDSNKPVNDFHQTACSIVCAKNQCELINKLLKFLTEEETAVFKRGRNAKSATVPKHSSVSDYRKATGFEALLGYLFITGRNDRIRELMDICFTSK